MDYTISFRSKKTDAPYFINVSGDADVQFASVQSAVKSLSQEVQAANEDDDDKDAIVLEGHYINGSFIKADLRDHHARMAAIRSQKKAAQLAKQSRYGKY